MIIGIGVDLIEVERVESLLRRHAERARERIFTAAEVEHCGGSRHPAESFAARFAAKEAVFKALGTGWTGGVAWREVEVLSKPGGAPVLRLLGRTGRFASERGVSRAHISLTHTRDLAGAYVVLEGDPEDAAAGVARLSQP
ncbi:MAG: holo-ACP synthase [Gemmatimonadota bacterium]